MVKRKKKKTLDLQNLEQLQAPVLTNRVILGKQTPQSLLICRMTSLPYKVFVRPKWGFVYGCPLKPARWHVSYKVGNYNYAVITRYLLSPSHQTSGY